MGSLCTTLGISVEDENKGKKGKKEKIQKEKVEKKKEEGDNNEKVDFKTEVKGEGGEEKGEKEEKEKKGEKEKVEVKKDEEEGEGEGEKIVEKGEVKKDDDDEGEGVVKDKKIVKDEVKKEEVVEVKKFIPSETAIILIEYQNDFTTEKGKLNGAVKECMEHTNMLENTLHLVTEARKKGVKIVHVPIMFSEDYSEVNGDFGVLKGIKEGKIFEKGQWGSEFYEPMKPVEGDVIANGKKGLCGFRSTNLDFILRQMGIENVFVCGFLTNCCVECTMRGAYEKGYYVVTLKDCCAATGVDVHENSFKNNFGMFSEMLTSNEVLERVE